ncbi:hypothetical protein L6205_25025 [Pseudomonas syringae pv. syringae]|uniref:hypothetical protein n=1 Tax=Pseudomonas syringae TaxID=317 RepID=UPI000CDA5BA6|nr:hypothetical protein [Pseudomonas syringae]MCH5532398.1 hypothetical protein [Pseudomonas syringae pv. syringae]MCH5541341.1 hypothetical protein [Pseudomonas syringae pv. syringae]MCH5544049.1 hypothetical protein [Pseudomonas syringae pv. syringae]MCH5604501.1 hypothetical protein [Pseudomonas syringae pv. syringae]MCH5607460.1 hypothetical protein [Pseudomonas syringae pv. syringae]
MSESKVKKAISVRFDPVEYANYSTMVENAGVAVSDGLRYLVTEKLQQAEAADMKKFHISFDFRWKERDVAFPEHIGNMLVTVTPPRELSVDFLQRLIFVIPEFWDDSGSGLNEMFRIDSAYFHRVTAEPHHRTSAKASRNVLSFHLLKSRWRAAIFDYGSGYKAEELEDRIRSAVTSHFTQTIRLYLIDHLPASRVLPEELFNEMMSFRDESTLDQMMALG